MKITARIDRIVQKGNVKAIASVSLDGMFVVKGLKVMDGRKGLFVSMPQESYPGQDGKIKYSNLFFALTNAAKMDLQDVVLQAYQQRMTQNQGSYETAYGNQGQKDYGYPQERYPQYPQPDYPGWTEYSDEMGLMEYEIGGI